MTPELTALLVCARAEIDTDTKSALCDSLAAVEDWPALLVLSEHNGLTPLLYKWAAGLPPGTVPQRHLEDMRDRAHRHAARAVLLTRELLALLSTLEDAGVRAMALKGPALGQELYGDPTIRRCADIDVLVPGQSAGRAIEVLGELGSVPQFHLEGRRLEDYRSSYYFLNFFHPAKGLYTDLHWGINTPGLAFSPCTDELFENASTIELMGRKVEVMSAENLLLFLAIHGSKHLWSRLGWAVDFAACLSRPGGIDWGAMYDKAERWGALRMMGAGAAVCADLFDMGVPKGSEPLFEAAPPRDDLLEGVLTSVSTGTVGQGFRGYHLPYMGLMDRKGDRARHALALFFTPTPLEWRIIDLPPALGFLYRVIRPLRLGAKHLLGRDL